MKLNEVMETKVISTEGYTSNCGDVASRKVNELLNQGWRILQVYTTCYDHQVAPQQQTVHFVLGIDYLSKMTRELD